MAIIVKASGRVGFTLPGARLGTSLRRHRLGTLPAPGADERDPLDDACSTDELAHVALVERVQVELALRRDPELENRWKNAAQYRRTEGRCKAPHPLLARADDRVGTHLWGLHAGCHENLVQPRPHRHLDSPTREHLFEAPSQQLV